MTPSSQTVRVHADGSIERGIDVPHEAANIPCGAIVGSQALWGGDENVPLRCKKRVGHETPKGEKRHVAADFRIVAAPGRVVHQARYAPNAIPRGVDQSITLPHDCDNHLDITNEVLERGW